MGFTRPGSALFPVYGCIIIRKTKTKLKQKKKIKKFLTDYTASWNPPLPKPGSLEK
jgi:hypothetical protein